MKVMVVYDSVYGNTEKIAKAIGSAIYSEVTLVRASEAEFPGLDRIEMFIVGSPTQGGRPTQPIQEFLANIPAPVIKDVKVAAFDTRYSGRFVKIFGFAADRIASSLSSAGGRLVSPPASFYVTGKRGPLKDGELERAARWAKEITT